MSNVKMKIVYSLQLHIALQNLGFEAIAEMKNPKHPNFNCWVYEGTEDFLCAFDELIRGNAHGS